ncbi:MAG: hypothetical protein IPK15_14015 [Verrucomicrobia bacterium]|nr:hypothetical protein [Verrucomicrobiota bacterium]
MGKQLLLAATAAALCLLASGTRAADFTVINTNNAGPGSLRQAILDANASRGTDRVCFDILGELRPVIGFNRRPRCRILRTLWRLTVIRARFMAQHRAEFDNAVRRSKSMVSRVGWRVRDSRQ